MINNKFPASLKQVMRNASAVFQLVLTHLHRTNTTERAIATYKDHIIDGLRSCDPSFMLHLWGRLIPQATLTLNLLR